MTPEQLTEPLVADKLAPFASNALTMFTWPLSQADIKASEPCSKCSELNMCSACGQLEDTIGQDSGFSCPWRELKFGSTAFEDSVRKLPRCDKR